jgi:hypothetical protein
MDDFNSILKKFNNRFQGKRKIDIFNVIMDSILSSPNPLKDRIYDRFRLLRDIPEETIPKWKDILELQSFIAKCFRINNRGIISQNLFMPESYESLNYFWNYVKRLLREYPSNLIEERAKEHVFGVLSELDIAFAPIIYEVDNLETLKNKKIIRCIMSESMSKNGFFDTIPLNIGVLDKLISGTKSNDRNYRELLKNLRCELKNLDEIKREIFSKCPGMRICRGKSRCGLEEDLWKAMKKIFIDKG